MVLISYKSQAQTGISCKQKKKIKMKKIITYVILILSILSCEEEIKENKKSDWEIRNEKRQIEVDSLYNSMAKNFQSEKEWEIFEYDYIYQLQDYLESKSGKFTVKNFYDYQIYRIDTSYFCAFRINEFNNEIFVELEIEKEKVDQLAKNQTYAEFYFYEVAVIEIDEFKPIDIEFESQLDDYDSRIVINRYKSLFGKGKIQEIKFVKEKKPVVNKG